MFFRTMDGGNSWIETNTGLTNTSVTWVGSCRRNNLCWHRGIGLSTHLTGGESWQPVEILSQPIDYHFAALSVSDAELYVGATRFADRNQGGVVGGVFSSRYRDQFVKRTLPLTVSCTGLNVLRSWAPPSMLAPKAGAFSVGTGVGFVDQSWVGRKLCHRRLSVNGKKIYAGTRRGEIFRLDSAGKSWKLISSDMVGSFISDLRWFGPTFYATSWENGVFRSTNDGNSWTPLNDGLEDLSVMAIETDSTDTYIGTYYDGVFQWEENRKQWERIGSLRRRVDSLVIHDSSLYAGTGRGWRVSGVDWEINNQF